MSHHNSLNNKTIQHNNNQTHEYHLHSNHHHRQEQRQRQPPPQSPPIVSLQLLNNMEKINMVPGFILKLWKMINDPQCDDLISWSDNGQSFIILDPPRFSQELSKYFKHNNLSSFIRQLNMYGFRKVATIENSGLHPGTDDLHFYHTDFIRDQPERLEAIKRKLPQKMADSVDLRNVYKGISEIEDKQKNVTKTLQDIKRENEILWSELHDLRQKHQQQQLYISRLMKLVFEAMEQNGIKTNMLQIKRSSPLMIEGSTGLSIADNNNIPATTPTTVPSPTLNVFDTNTTATAPAAVAAASPTTLINPENLDSSTKSTTSPSPISMTDTILNTQTGSSMLVATTMTSDDSHSLKKSRLTSPVEDCGDAEAYHSNEQQDSTFQLQQNIDLNTPLHTTNFDEPDQFQLVSNDHLQAQIDTAEFQIDTLVPTIGDFNEDDLNLFSE